MSLLITEGLGTSGGGGGILPLVLQATLESHQMDMTVENELELTVVARDASALSMTVEGGYSMEMTVTGGSMTMVTHCEVD